MGGLQIGLIVLLNTMFSICVIFTRIVNLINKSKCYCSDDKFRSGRLIIKKFDEYDYFWVLISANFIIIFVIIILYNYYKNKIIREKDLYNITEWQFILTMLIGFLSIINWSIMIIVEFDEIPINKKLDGVMCYCTYKNNNFYRFMLWRVIVSTTTFGLGIIKLLYWWSINTIDLLKKLKEIQDHYILLYQYDLMQ